MKLRFPLFIAIVVVFGTIQSAATTCKSKPPKVKNASGVVLFHGTPLARVSVEVIREDGNGVPEASMVTGEDGRFLLPVREKGLHRLKVTWPKMHPAISSVDSAFADIDVRSVGTPKHFKYKLVINLDAGCAAWLEKKGE